MSDKALQIAIESFAEDGNFSPDCIKKWFTEVGIIGEKTGITETDVDSAIAKISNDKKGLDFVGLKECINELAKEKNMKPKILLEKLATAGKKQSVADAEAKPDIEDKEKS